MRPSSQSIAPPLKKAPLSKRRGPLQGEGSSSKGSAPSSEPTRLRSAPLRKGLWEASLRGGSLSPNGPSRARLGSLVPSEPTLTRRALREDSLAPSAPKHSFVPSCIALALREGLLDSTFVCARALARDCACVRPCANWCVAGVCMRVFLTPRLWLGP